MVLIVWRLSIMAAVSELRSVPVLIVRCFIVFLLLTGAPALAEESAVEASPQVASFPGLDQLVPRLSALTTEAADTTAQLVRDDVLEGYRTLLAERQEKQTELSAQLQEWGEIGTWPANRLLDARLRLLEVRKRNQELLARLAQPLKEQETLRTQWRERETFWQGWEADLRQRKAGVSKETFASARQTIRETSAGIARSNERLLELQQQISRVQEETVGWLNRIDAVLAGLRKETFRRNAYPLFSGSFFSQLNRDLLEEARLNLNTVTIPPRSFFQDQGWVLPLQGIVLLLSSLFLFYRTKRRQPISSEWRFLFRHPVAAGVFVSALVGGVLFKAPPPLVRWGLLCGGALAACVLICAQVGSGRMRRIIVGLTALFLTTETLNIVALPRPLYRLYLLVVCLAVIVVSLRSAAREKSTQAGEPGMLAPALYTGALLALFALITQLVGFATLAANLFDATLGTLFVLFVARMATHLGDGAIHELLQTGWIRKRAFIRSLGHSTERRLKRLLHLFIAIYALLYLLYIWKLFASPAEAWQALTDWEVVIGEVSLSLGMILLALLTLYLSLLFSWGLQAFVDSQLLTPQRTDRGVRDAVKKLLHYALVLVGVLVAASIAGIALEKFALLAGALGVGIGFGLQNIVNNFVSGLILLFERPVKVGDAITIDGEWGKIIKIGLRSTVFETYDRAEVIIPNSELISQKVTNWTFSNNISRIVLPVGVAYGTPLEEVIKILLQVAKENSDVLEDPTPAAIFTGFGNSSIDFELRVMIPDIDLRIAVISELGQAIDRRFKEAGIVIPFPQRDLHLCSVSSDLQGLMQASQTPERHAAEAPHAEDGFQSSSLPERKDNDR
jgi:small-conductance mechanosensitive channel